MKLDRLNDYVLAATVVLLGIVGAVLCGRSAGSGNDSLLWMLGASVIYLVTCLALRSRIWMLILIFWGCSGQLNSAPGHLPLRDLIVGGLVAYFATLKAFKVIREKAVYNWLDILLWLNVLYVASLYLRYPIGVSAFGAEMVGGRAYLEIIFALGGYWVLGQVKMTPGQAKVFPLLLSALAAVFAVINTITYLVPSTVPILGKLYGGVDAESYQRGLSESGGGGGGEADVGEDRAHYLSDVGTGMISVMCS